MEIKAPRFNTFNGKQEQIDRKITHLQHFHHIASSKHLMDTCKFLGLVGWEVGSQHASITALPVKRPASRAWQLRSSPNPGIHARQYRPVLVGRTERVDWGFGSAWIDIK